MFHDYKAQVAHVGQNDMSEVSMIHVDDTLVVHLQQVVTNLEE